MEENIRAVWIAVISHDEFQIPVIKAQVPIMALIGLSRTMLHLSLYSHRGPLTVDAIYTNSRERPSTIYIEVILSSFIHTEAPVRWGFLSTLTFFFANILLTSLVLLEDSALASLL